MSLQRQLRRQAQKHGTNGNLANPLAKLTEALSEIKKVSEIGQTAQGLEALSDKLKEAATLVQELTQLRDDLKAVASRDDLYLVELERQRAVFLRFLFCPDLLMTSGQNNLQRFLAAEDRYRREYDAMCFLVKLLTWVKEDTTP